MYDNANPDRERSLRAYHLTTSRLYKAWDELADVIDMARDDQARRWLAYLVADLTLMAYDETGYDGRYQRSNYLYAPARTLDNPTPDAVPVAELPITSHQ